MSERRRPRQRYPIGWFQVAYSDEVAPGQVLPLRYFGRELVLFRGEGGQARVFDAYCPHLGAHLGYGGTVVGDTIRCPFHAWRFDGEGRCVEIPYAKRIPPAAGIRPWPMLERNGMILVYHDPRGLEPEYEIPELPEVGSAEWTPFEFRRWKIRTHNQEMGENQVDAAHFRFVHGTLTVPEMTAEVEGPVMKVTGVSKMGTPRGEVTGTIASSSWGFGISTVRFAGIVDTLLVAAVTPIDEEYVDVRFSFTVKKLGSEAATAGVGRALIEDIEKQMSEDTPIWEHKTYHERPVLCDGDGPIALYRRWCRQFYLPEEAAA